jgi:predicted  nucleic acid-binding Zn-ribbon protein
MSRKKTVNDIIGQTEAKLETLNQQSTGAVQVMINTINEFDSIEAEISTTLDEIGKMESRMAATRAGLESRLAYNSKIRENFKQLLGLE